MASIAFTAPESIKATGVDHRADIYSLGCALYELLTGKTPFTAPEPAAWPVSRRLICSSRHRG